MKSNNKGLEKPQNHLALYRKYRPSRFEDMLGQESGSSFGTGISFGSRQ
jgi:hypothetical protein